MSNFGNLLIAGIASGAIYAVFGACLSLWFRVANVLNLAVGDFAMLGTLLVARFAQSDNLPEWLAVVITLVIAGLAAWIFDWVVLHRALDRGRGHSGTVTVFFYTFALSFILEGVAKDVFGTDTYAAPAFWSGPPLRAGGLNIPRTDILVVGLALISGLAIAAYLRFTVAGKASSAAGQSLIGSRIVGIDTQRLRRHIFIATAMLAALFGIVESPLNGFVYSTGPTISLIGVVAAGFSGFQRPGRAVAMGLGIGVLEAMLGGYLSTQYDEVLLYGVLAAILIFWPEVLGRGALVQQ